MLNKEDELRLASIRGVLQAELDGKSDYSLPLETIIWLAGVAKTLNDELKHMPQVQHNCDGTEMHFHYQVAEHKYTAHSHRHDRQQMHTNSLHHHPPQDHRRSRE